MARLDEVRDALIEAPASFGLIFTYPQPRIDAPPYPVRVEEARIEGQSVKLTIARGGLKGNHQLVPSDVIWHQDSNAVALVVQSIDRKTCRVLGLMAPETEAEREAFLRTKGAGNWVCVFQAWKEGWELPAPLKALPQMIDASNPQAYDALPASTRAQGKMGGWAGQGLIDPSRMLTAKTSAFLERQRAAMLNLHTIPDEETTPWDDGKVLEPGEVSIQTIPLDGSRPKEVIKSAREVRGGIIG